MTEPIVETEATLKEWVREGRVTWEIANMGEQVEHSRVNVGFEVRLFAQHPDGKSVDPGCEDCQELFGRLRTIAESVFPKGQRPTRYDIDSFDSSLHHRAESHWTPEVQLTIRIEHREGHFQEVDECEKRCAEEIQAGLKALGVQPRTWNERRSA